MSNLSNNNIIGLSSDRLKHSIAVARKMKEIAESTIPPLTKDRCEDLFLLGYLHDIGYEFVNKAEDHAHVGGEILKRQGYKYWKEVFCHGDPNTDYHSNALILLNISDLSINSRGEDVGVEARLEDIKSRYGKNSKQFVEAEMLSKRIGLI